jgi:bifunctional non-homologous end joining protein LigD
MPTSSHAPARDTSIATYKAKRDFTVTREPAPGAASSTDAPVFVVQKHDATRLHYDFRLEHGGVLWSWAVPRGPSLDPKDKRLAVHVEDHPLDYAGFEGTIPEGQYGAGTVEIWDRGTWAPVGSDPAADLARGEMKFTLEGSRLHGRFVLIRLKPRPKERAENWLLIKEHDEHESAGTGVDQMSEQPLAPVQSMPVPVSQVPTPPPRKTAATGKDAPAAGAKRAKLPQSQAIQLASLAEQPPESGEWISEIKYDGYRLLVFKQGKEVRLLTRNGLDWTHRIKGLAASVAALPRETMLLDGELVALRPDGFTSFADLQAAISDGNTGGLVFYAFDLLHLDGWDLRPCRLDARKAVMAALDVWTNTIRYSEHLSGDAGPIRREACTMGLEGIITKKADAPYRAGRNGDWLKLKCKNREEFIVLGWTPPSGSRTGIGALHLGFHDASGTLHYIGGCGTGFKDEELASLRKRLDALAAPAPEGLLLSGERPDTKISWVRPELVAEVQYAGWSGAGRIRHAVYLGLREDKAAAEVVRDLPDPEAKREPFRARRSGMVVTAKPPDRTAPVPRKAGAPPPPPRTGAVKLTHPDRELWPGISKQMLADYWAAVAPAALHELAKRPLALVRCPDGVDGQHFFQKHAMKGMQNQFREGDQDGAPYLTFDDADGLQAAAQMAAIELHSWGSAVADAGHADRLVFDLDPGPGVDWAVTVKAAHTVRERLERVGLASFCRTSGGKGLHIVAPVLTEADWDTVRAWCRAFAEAMEAELPDQFVASVPKARRSGRILVDWLRNGLGSTAVGSFSPRARPGATVATPVTWQEVTPKLDPAALTIATVPKRLARLKADPWDGFTAAARTIPIGDVTPAKKRAR